MNCSWGLTVHSGPLIETVISFFLQGHTMYPPPPLGTASQAWGSETITRYMYMGVGSAKESWCLPPTPELWVQGRSKIHFFHTKKQNAPLGIPTKTRDTGADESVSKRTNRKDPAMAFRDWGRSAQGAGSTGAWACPTFKTGFLMLRMYKWRQPN